MSTSDGADGWRPIDTAPEGVEVETVITDDHGIRNHQTLVFDRGLWWFPSRSMYVYYRPTHWRPVPDGLQWPEQRS